MLDIKTLNHIGMRVSDRARTTAFYETLGFEFLADHGFGEGHPIEMRHPGGLLLNILGPANKGQGENILMDVEEKYPGYTHFAIDVGQIQAAERFLDENGIAITGRRKFEGGEALFIRDPDRNVIELIGS